MLLEGVDNNHNKPGINLKKYNVDNLTDFDLTYKRIEDNTTMSWYYEVCLNNKLIGNIKCINDSNYSSRCTKVRFTFTSEANNYCIYGDSGETLDDLKEKLNLQIKNPIKFIMKFWENK